jgi:hypothetical protein
MEKIIFSAQYGSHINGTTNEKSDNDVYVVFLNDNHIAQSDKNPFRVTAEQVRHKDGVIYRSLPFFILNCFFGIPFFADVLYLDEKHFSIPLPESLKVARDKRIFLTQTAVHAMIHRADAYYGIRKRQWTEYQPKVAYHSYLALLTADDVSRGLPPDFTCKGKQDLLRMCRYEWSESQYRTQFDILRRSIQQRRMTLPRAPDYRLAHRLYQNCIAECMAVGV